MSVIFVTGTSSGIGFETVIALAEKESNKVYATCRTPEEAIELIHLAKQHRNITLLKLDVTSTKAVDAVIGAIYKKEKRIDVVIHNAGGGVYGPAETHTPKQMRQIFETNFFAIDYINKVVLPIMRHQKSGKIISLCSISGLVPSANLSGYSASKAALAFLAAGDRFHLAPHIKVALIVPGPVVTKYVANAQNGKHFFRKCNPYPSMLPNRAKWENMMEKGQPASEVAQVILKVIEHPDPAFINPTSPEVEARLKTVYKDLDALVPKTVVPLSKL